jgi:hypothetical protein
MWSAGVNVSIQNADFLEKSGVFLVTIRGRAFRPDGPASRVALENSQLRGQRAYVEFFTANIRSPNTQRAYARAGGAWCEDCGLTAHDDPAA